MLPKSCSGLQGSAEPLPMLFLTHWVNDWFSRSIQHCCCLLSIMISAEVDCGPFTSLFVWNMHCPTRAQAIWIFLRSKRLHISHTGLEFNSWLCYLQPNEENPGPFLVRGPLAAALEWPGCFQVWVLVYLYHSHLVVVLESTHSYDVPQTY